MKRVHKLFIHCYKFLSSKMRYINNRQNIEPFHSLMTFVAADTAIVRDK